MDVYRDFSGHAGRGAAIRLTGQKIPRATVPAVCVLFFYCQFDPVLFFIQIGFNPCLCCPGVFHLGQFFLKFVVSHPVVTCVIPATSKVHHMTDNMAANFGKLPSASMRKRMLEYFERL